HDICTTDHSASDSYTQYAYRSHRIIGQLTYVFFNDKTTTKTSNHLITLTRVFRNSSLTWYMDSPIVLKEIGAAIAAARQPHSYGSKFCYDREFQGFCSSNEWGGDQRRLDRRRLTHTVRRLRIRSLKLWAAAPESYPSQFFRPKFGFSIGHALQQNGRSRFFVE